MTNRYPLVLDTAGSSPRIKELPANDDLYLKNNNIVDVRNITSEGSISTRSISITGYGSVINSQGQWVGDPINLQGFTGSQGEVGFTGSQGEIGFTGSQGTQGFTGSQGVIGFTGSQGDIGFTGSQGVNGIVNISEDSTNSIRYITFLDTTTGPAENILISSTKLFFNPFTETLSSTFFSGTVVAPSDIKLKENIEPIVNAKEILEKLNPVKYILKDGKHISYGLIAQELEKILSELVVDVNGTKHVSYIPLIAFLIAEIKQLRSIIDSK